MQGRSHLVAVFASHPVGAYSGYKEVTSLWKQIPGTILLPLERFCCENLFFLKRKEFAPKFCFPLGSNSFLQEGSKERICSRGGYNFFQLSLKEGSKSASLRLVACEVDKKKWMPGKLFSERFFSFSTGRQKLPSVELSPFEVTLTLNAKSLLLTFLPLKSSPKLFLF